MIIMDLDSCIDRPSLSMVHCSTARLRVEVRLSCLSKSRSDYLFIHMIDQDTFDACLCSSNPTTNALNFCLLFTCLQGQLLVLPRGLALPCSIAYSGLVITPDLVFVNCQTLQPDGSTRVDLVGADTDLGSKAVAHAISKTARRVPVGAGGVDLVHETLSFGLVRSEDDVGVVRAVGVDVRDGLVDVGNNLNGDFEGEVLRVVVLRGGVDDGALGEGGGG